MYITRKANQVQWENRTFHMRINTFYFSNNKLCSYNTHCLLCINKVRYHINLGVIRVLFKKSDVAHELHLWIVCPFNSNNNWLFLSIVQNCCFVHLKLLVQNCITIGPFLPEATETTLDRSGLLHFFVFYLLLADVFLSTDLKHRKRVNTKTT